MSWASPSTTAVLQVAAELVQDERARGRALRLLALTDAGSGLLALATLVAREELDDLLADLVEVGAELDEDLRGHALTLTDESEQDVLGADVGVAELQSLTEGVLEDLLGPRGEGDVAGRGLLALADDLLHLLADGCQGDVEVLEGLGGKPLALVDEAQQDVLGADVVVVEHAGFFLRQHHNPSGPICEPFEHRHSSLPVETPHGICHACRPPPKLPGGGFSTRAVRSGQLPGMPCCSRP